MYTLSQKFLAEFLGTFAVVFFALGAIAADQFLRVTTQSGLTVLGLATAYGLTYAIMITAVGHISGGHLNPAVTIGYWVTRRLNTTQTIIYWIAQLLGATVAAWALVAILPEANWRSEVLGSVTPYLSNDLTRIHGMLLEGILTFILVFVFFATAVDVHGAFHKIAGFAIGLTVVAASLCATVFTGAALNPARAFGPALVTRHWTNHGVYWVGPLLGGVLAAVLYDKLFLTDQQPS